MRSVLRVFLAAAPVAALLVPTAAVAVATPALAATTGSTPAWTPPVKLSGGGAEPSIRIAPDGRTAAYIAAPSSLGSNFWTVGESVDSAGITHFTPSDAQQPDLGTGGGDAEISVGQRIDPTTGCAPIAYSGLHNIDLLDNFTVATSSDCGKTFTLANPYATQNTLTDRQWQTFDGKLTNHLIYHKVDTGQIVDSVSYDGGQHYVTLGTPTGAVGVIDPSHAYTMQNVKIGNILTDETRPVAGQTYPINGEQVHTLWATFAGSRDAADAAQGVAGSGGWDHLDTIYVARSDDGGLTWTDTTAYTTGANETRELDLIFPVLSQDKAGNLYSAWTDGNLIQYVVSTDAGKTWSKAYTVNPGEAGAQKTNGTANLFPWIAAGGAGRLDVVWYHGEGGDTTGYRNVGTADTKWTVAFAQLADATAVDSNGVAAPTVVERDLAVTPIMHTGNVCNNGTTCGITDNGDRTLLDFFQVAIDGAGRANIAYADDQGSAGTAHVEYTRQNSGQSVYDGSAITPSVFATDGGATCTPDGVITDPSGDATGAVLVASTPMPSQADLDVTKAWISSTPATSTDPESLTFHIHVTDLGTTGGEYFRFYFSYGTTQYLTIMSRDQTGAKAYSLNQNGTTGASSLKAITGAFNTATNEVTATFSLNDFNSTAKPTTPLADGASLGGLQVLGQRDAGVLTATSDTATGTCPYIVGATGGPAATLPETPVTVLLPIAGGLIGGWLLLRRRREAQSS